MMRKGFTLIEVMVSVLIISLVIFALLEMRGNGSQTLLNLKEQMNINTFNSFLIGNENYGFESKSITSDKLISDFKVDNKLRRKLKKIKLKVKYQEVDTTNIGSGMIFEIGKTVFSLDNSSSSLIRLRLR